MKKVPTNDKFVVAGRNVRVYLLRSHAINMANSMTSSFDRQFSAVQAKGYGWLIKDVVLKEVYDVEGKLPSDVVEALQIRN